MSLEESVKGHFLEYNAPCDCFLNFYDEYNRENVVYQTNFYTQQKQKSKSTLSVKGKEFYGFVRLNLYIVYHELPLWLDYWKQKQSPRGVL